ncbi:MAG: hypothetical protein QOF33_1737 [Thermomicrobiales bacterium]|nr:hypothetical protein [Thermomicrobiales bacterium]
MPNGRVASVVLVAFLMLSGTVGSLGRSAGETSAQEEQAGPAAQQLIGAALETGQLDYGTSLVYRAYALFGDERLPDEFAGADAVEDPGFFAEVRLNWDELPGGTRDQLTPFIVRPNDARSIFAAKPAGEATGADEGADTGTGFRDTGDCVEDWATAIHPTFPVKVWMRCTDDYAADLERVVSLIDGFWQPEVDLMGPPKADTGTAEAGGDTRIDLYVLDFENDVFPRNGGTPSPLREGTAAMAIADDPIEGKTASGYMIARRSELHDEVFQLTLAHEFFHVLQYAHNVTITWGFSSTPYGEFDVLRYTPYWFFEATPTWVESYVYRGKVSDGAMLDGAHSRFSYSFNTDEPLFTSVAHGSRLASNMYAAYIWFYFVEQEVGPEAIGQIWRNLEAVNQDDWDGTLDAIDSVLSFEENFREFAVRNLNLDLQPGDPISPSYADMDSAFPEGIPPVLAIGEGKDRRLEAQGAGEPERQVEATIKPLSAQYYYLVPQDDVAAVTLDFSGMAPAETLDVDLIVRIKDKGWERRELGVDDPTVLCRAIPDDDVEAFYLVLSNHSTELDGALGGSFTVGASAESCA